MNRFEKAIALLAVIFSLSILFPTFAKAMDKKEVESIVREYLKNNPQEIARAMQAYEAEQRKAQQEAQLKQALANRVEVPVGDSPVQGPDSATITIVEFSDFECPYCARSVGTINQLMQKYWGRAKLVFKNAPLPFHAKAPDAHKAAMAAEAQGRFWEYRAVLMAKQNEWGQSSNMKSNFVKYAKDLKMDVAKFEKDLSNPAYQKRMEEDQALAKKLGVGGTPTYFINGAKVVGAQQFDFFDKVMTAVIKN